MAKKIKYNIKKNMPMGNINTTFNKIKQQLTNK